MEKIKAYGVCLYKKEEDGVKILLCKSVQSKDKWGFLKGVQESYETPKETAIREFIEESSIEITQDMLEECIMQINKEKDIGIYLVDSKKVKDLDRYFYNDNLFEHHLSWENSKVKFFNIKSLPLIKKKQTDIAKDIVNLLTTN